MYLGIASLGANAPAPGVRTPAPVCNFLSVYEQLRVCQDNPEAMPCVSLGARLGIHECQEQFKYERWNCTTSKTRSVFGAIIEQGTRETAFIYAVTAAGVVHAITASCSAGNLTDCSCDLSREGTTAPEGWRWGGCSDNIDYGMWFARSFVDAPAKLKHDNTRDILALMNLHNNEVGRKVIPDLMNLKCRCHGVSGSCAVKTCWRTMPSFRHVGDVIKDKYLNKATLVAPKSKNRLRPRAKRERRKAVSYKELVFKDKSPNFCKQDSGKGILGTTGRECKVDGPEGESCESLCCGRGYNTEVIRHVERCHCKFVWCCEVKCKTCETLVDRHTCK